MHIGKRGSAALAALLLTPLTALAASAYTATLTLASPSPSVGGTDKATLKLANTGTAPAAAGLFIGMPSGFSASGLTSTCGGTLTDDGTSRIALSGMTVPAGGTCTLGFTLGVPPVAALPPAGARSFTITADTAAGLATLTAATAPTLSGFLGSTPGLYSDTSFPSTVRSVGTLDLFITPATDPGPNSNVFWSNQIGSLNGYTGLQSTELVSASEGVGKQFLFSLWGATAAKPGTPASAGIGAGSYCTVSGSATDGSAGAQCRYRYEWHAGHTYRFRVTPDTSQGPGWFKSNVTDVTNGTTGDSFDIGSIYVGTTQTQVPVGWISQWVEYFDWNSSRTSCASIAHTDAQFSIRAYDAIGNAVPVPAPSVTVNKSCPASYANASQANGVATLIGGPQQSAAGLVKSSGACLTASGGLADGSVATLGTCPTLASVRASGGTHFNPQLWVVAGDGTLQTKYSYCLTAQAPGSTSGALLRTCVPGTASQQWQVKAGTLPGTAQLVSQATGRCLAPAGGALTLQACSAATAVWRTPGKSFAY
ncbi:hypothetical protein WL88_24320 [Burkholderia diffusa]|uniref:Ricin B lectin domain-containing protein n=1 Tax=Burkholderia diffusa TaxID=488732 RepID=A0AAW3P8W8_9BURK|nr:DUF3472 domain-containing protein [Burkholderia diffusa]KWF32500.1 hypothetical protein WL86_28330 [Burkholderia diffusa]KWF38423.1 hypothetical protein WL85_09505 [Burkholderia diffusa]KWF43480.1 hypothetical protein WL87_05945 [Burkholderia diffusa]KWF46470.1 hypothetical protein WL88_24320 [Burkholderia diffusa]